MIVRRHLINGFQEKLIGGGQIAISLIKFKSITPVFIDGSYLKD